MAREQIVILWGDTERDTVNGLAWDGGSGPLRVYGRDQYDPRAGENVPYCGSVEEACAYWTARPNQPAQCPPHVARQFGFAVTGN
jgi:hypothetical protein